MMQPEIHVVMVETAARVALAVMVAPVEPQALGDGRLPA
jgi:hypothetical protein